MASKQLQSSGLDKDLLQMYVQTRISKEPMGSTSNVSYRGKGNPPPTLLLQIPHFRIQMPKPNNNCHVSQKLCMKTNSKFPAYFSIQGERTKLTRKLKTRNVL